MRTKDVVTIILVLCFLLGLSGYALANLEEGFLRPPDSARPHMYWYWMGGNTTKEGITADLEAMQRVGVGGALIFFINVGTPLGPVKFGSPEWLDMVKHAVREARRLGLELGIYNCGGWTASGGPWNTPEHAMQIVVTSEMQVKGPMQFHGVLPQPPIRSADRSNKKLHFYRDIAAIAFRTPAGDENKAPSKADVESLAGLLFLERWDNFTLKASVAAGTAVQGEKIVDLTGKMDPDGNLSWDVPDGNWTILRVGYTPNGWVNGAGPAESIGLECDKLSKEAVQAHWDGMMSKIIAELGSDAGNVKAGLTKVHIDSYEEGSENWTPKFREEFQKRRGYDLFKFLPVFSGRVVDSPEITERFMWDLRRTVADLFAENYAGQFAEMAHKAGLEFSLEPYGGCPTDDFQYGSYADIPMGESWYNWDYGLLTVKLAACVGHVYGKKYVGAEAYTAQPWEAGWLSDPYSLKAGGDAIYCLGVNRLIYHVYAQQPWMDRLPGMTMSRWGTCFGRTVTWWEQARDWVKYQTRCQYLLQAGLFVADVCFYCGDGAPNCLLGNSSGPSEIVRRGGLMPGYDYDACTADALMRMSVKNGRIVLPSGMSYRMLVLSPDKTMMPEAMTPAVVRKIKELVDAGGTVVVGPKPEKSPSLVGYPKCDEEVKKLADEVWGAESGKHKERVLSGSVNEALAAVGLKPDFEFSNKKARIVYIHRVVNGADVYFVSNQKPLAEESDCTFRVSGKAPELWHADTGRIEKAPVYTEQDGRTTVPLKFDPAGSVFVVFRQAVPADHVVAVAPVGVGESREPVQELTILKAEYGDFGKVGDPKCVDVTAIIKNKVKDGKLDVEVDNRELAGGAPAHKSAGDLYLFSIKELRVEYRLNGEVRMARALENRHLTLPDESASPFPVPDYELTAKDDGRLELKAWKPGRFELKTAAGKVMKAEVRDVPKPMKIDGPWEVKFPPNWGAPEKITLDKLISWTEHSDSGVKYFSGTATYIKTFDFSKSHNSRLRIILDLGDLRNVAEVKLNGKDFGVLWKPPYRLDITDAISAKQNVLEVKVVNLWTNRLIGDEQLPDDRKWGKTFKDEENYWPGPGPLPEEKQWLGPVTEWPKWMLEGKPSPTGRFTFTTWHHWTKSDEPLPSGLFGPVTIRTVERKVVK